MADQTPECPSLDQLKAMIDGALSGQDQTSLQSHIEACGACQSALESLVAVSESWDSELRQLRMPPETPHGTVLSDAMRQMKEDDPSESKDHRAAADGNLSFLQPSDQPNSIGRLGIYEVTEVIGQGGMGVVLKAFDPALHRVVAVKVLAPYLANNPQARKRFVREAQAIAAVCHDHVITIHAIDDSIEQPKIVMQYVAGRSLQQKIDAEGSLELKEILRIGMQTAAGLAAAHAQGLVHRDVKPSNILLENGIQRVRLTDFGLARAVDDASLTQSGAIAGTPQYMAPEQANGDAVDYRADLFSLGSVLYAMCTGHSPFRASTTMGVLKRVCHDPPRLIEELNPDIPEWLCEIVMKLLAKSPADRFQSARAVADLLEKWLAHIQQPKIVARPTPVKESPQIDASVPAENALPETESTATGAVNMIPQPPPAYDNSAVTILFQHVSLRSILFFFLLGMAGTHVVAYFERRMSFQEKILLGFVAGLFTVFWGILFVALVRLIWANFQIFLRWVRKEPAAPNGIKFDSPLPRQQIRHSGGLPPESLAMLAAIGTMVLSFNPFIAAIVAIIVWRMRTSMRPAAANPSTPDSPQSVASNSWSEQARSFLEPLEPMSRSAHLWGEKLVSAMTVERTRLLLSIGWCIGGGIDLLFALLNNSRFVLLIGFWLILALLSFVVAHGIQSGQNRGLVKLFSYLGLLPVSFGSIIRIPNSIATLFWLSRNDQQSTFDGLPFWQTQLGQMIESVLKFLKRSLGTVGWSCVWTLFWLLLVAAFAVVLIVPSAPFEYKIYDKSVITLRHRPEIRFELTASGTGIAIGLPPSPAYRRELIGFGQVGATREQQVLVPVDSASEAAIAEALATAIGDSSRLMASSLLKSIQGMQQQDAAVTSAADTSRSTITQVLSRINQLARPRSADGPWEGMNRLGRLLDTQTFKVELDRNLSHFSYRLVQPVAVIGGLLTVAGWLFGLAWITRRRHFRQGRLSPREATV